MGAERSLQSVILKDEDGNIVGIVLDGSVYRLETVGKMLNASGTQINPATEETLDSIKDTDGIKKITDALPAGTNVLGKLILRNPGDTVDLGDASNPVRIDTTGTTTQPISAASLPLPSGAATEATLSSIDGKDFATQTTLSAADTKLGTIDGVLDSIKDTDGIKKITDPLAAGTNRIGAVRIMDEADNIFDSILNNLIRRLETRSSITSPNGASDADVGTTATANSRLSVASRLTDGVDWLATVVNNTIRRLETRGSVTAPDGTVDADVGTSATSNNRLSVASRLTDGTDWLATVVNNTIRRLESRNSITAPDGSLDVAVVTDNSINRLEARTSIVGQTAGSGSEKKASVIDDVTDSNVKRLQVEALVASGGANQKVVLVDETNTVELSVADNVTLPANTHGLMMAGVDDESKSQFLSVESSGKLKVASQPPVPPPGTTEFVLAINEVDLEINGGDNPSEAESAVIGNNVNMYLQNFVGGAAGDPSEKGSKVEIYWREGAGPTDHLIERIYVAGQSVVVVLPDINKARDGTQLTGNGTNTKLVLVRNRLSNADQEVDAIVRGYTE